MQVNTLLLLAIGIVSLAACALGIGVAVLRGQLKDKAGEIATAKNKVSELQQALDKAKASAMEAKKRQPLKATPLLWMNNASSDSPENAPRDRGISADIPSPEHESKYKGLYCKLDEHIQKF